MYADSKPLVLIRVSSYIEMKGVGEHSFISIGGHFP